LSLCISLPPFELGYAPCRHFLFSQIAIFTIPPVANHPSTLLCLLRLPSRLFTATSSSHLILNNYIST
jgi:hypothetical protein